MVKNANWNADIPVGGCVEFGISVNENFAGFPSTYKLLGENTQVQEDAYSVEYILDSDWGDGFTGRILITNNTDQAVEDWVLEFEFDRDIIEIWNGVISEQDGSYYAITNAGYNANINPGEIISFGFKGTNGNATDEPFDFELSQMKYVQGDDNLDAILAELEEYRKKQKKALIIGKSRICRSYKESLEIFLRMLKRFIIVGVSVKVQSSMRKL